MSIWCSTDVIGFDDDEPPNGQVRSYVHGWSNHYPTTDGTAERPAMIDTAYIAPWCVPGWHDREDECDDDMVGPWFRLAIDTPDTSIAANGVVTTGEQQHATVVLDETAVRALADVLHHWLARPKAQPDHQ